MGAMTMPLQQSLGFARALTAFGAQVSCDAPVMLNRHIWPLGRVGFTSRGPLHLSDLRELRAAGLRAFNGEHDAPLAYRAAGFAQIITPVHIAEWDLRAPPDQRRAALHPKWRNQLRRAETSGLRLRERVWDGSDHPLFHHADTTARARKFRALPTPLIATFAQLNAGDALIFEAYEKGHLIAALLVLRHGDTATLQTAWSAARGRATNAHNLMLMTAADRLAALGHDTFDLGLVETENAATLARFKLRTGAALRRLGGTWIAIPGM